MADSLAATSESTSMVVDAMLTVVDGEEGRMEVIGGGPVPGDYVIDLGGMLSLNAIQRTPVIVQDR